MRTRLTLAVVAVTLVAAPHLSAQKPETEEGSPSSAVKKEEAPSPHKEHVSGTEKETAHSRLLPGRRIVIDQETGRPRTPTAAERARMSTSDAATVRVRRLTQTELPNGRGWRLNLEGRLVHAVHATVNDDGSVEVAHAHGPVHASSNDATSSNHEKHESPETREGPEAPEKAEKQPEMEVQR